MCDIWKANSDKKELSVEVLTRHVKRFKELGVKEIVFSGGEALMHSNLWSLCGLLKKEGIALTLLSTGLLLERNAKAIVENFREVIVSIDGSSSVHNTIRNIPGAFEKLTEGVKALHAVKSDFRVTARCVLQRINFADFIPTVKAAQEIGLSQISFLAADISTDAFNHPDKIIEERVHDLALTSDETEQFKEILDNSFDVLKSEYEARFIAESPAKMLRILQYYKALNGDGSYPRAHCNAPWVSAVIESDGRVMPCFFHEPYGNILHEDADLNSILNSPNAVAFRKNLDVSTNPVCQKCVCTLSLGWMEMI